MKRILLMGLVLTIVGLGGCGKSGEKEGLKFPTLNKNEADLAQGEEDVYGTLSYNINPETGVPYTKEELIAAGIFPEQPDMNWADQSKDTAEGKSIIEGEPTTEQDIMANANPSGGVDYFIERPEATEAHLAATKEAQKNQVLLENKYSDRIAKFEERMAERQEKSNEGVSQINQQNQQSDLALQISELNYFIEELEEAESLPDRSIFPDAIKDFKPDTGNSTESELTQLKRAVQAKQNELTKQMEGSE